MAKSYMQAFVLYSPTMHIYAQPLSSRKTMLCFRRIIVRPEEHLVAFIFPFVIHSLYSQTQGDFSSRTGGVPYSDQLLYSTSATSDWDEKSKLSSITRSQLPKNILINLVAFKNNVCPSLILHFQSKVSVVSMNLFPLLPQSLYQ